MCRGRTNGAVSIQREAVSAVKGDRCGIYIGEAVRDVYRKVLVRDLYRENGTGLIQEEQCGMFKDQ
tara:strand:+ start:256 stop:453 length:198 start_codon:yes stop_codon:yes gene_type:complete